MKLYSYWRSTTSFRVRAALNLKGVAYDTMPVDLLAGAQGSTDYAALNPGKGVPTLVLEDGTVLVQSMAIMDYLDRVYPTPALLPDDPLQRTGVLAAAHVFALDVHPVNNLRTVKHLQSKLDASAEDVKAWMLHWMDEGCKTLEVLLPERAGFAFGPAPGLADLCITAQLYNAHRWGLDLAPYPKIRRIEAACLEVPAIRAAHPDNQPDAKDAT